MTSKLKPSDIKYHFNSPFARLMGRLNKSKGNWCVTIGPDTFVSRNYIVAQSRAHEFGHSLQAERLGRPKFLWRYLKANKKYGYKNNPFEIEAHLYALQHKGEFSDIGQVPTQGA